VTAPVELPLAAPAPAARAVAAISPERYRELAPRVRLLSWLSLGAMSVEGVVALVAGVAVKEGREAWHGDGCCVGSPLDGFAVDACNDDCCH
jgi:hypothetical protein